MQFNDQYVSIAELLANEKEIEELRVEKASYSDKKSYTLDLRELPFVGSLRSIKTDKIATIIWPEDVSVLKGITSISIFRASKLVLPKYFSEMSNLQQLDLNQTELEQIDPSILELPSLEILKFSEPYLADFPEKISSKSLRVIDLFLGNKERNFGGDFPELSRFKMSAIKELKLSAPKLRFISLNSFKNKQLNLNFECLEKLYIGYTSDLSELNLDAPSLQILSIDSQALNHISCTSKNLTTAILKNLKAAEIPAFILANKSLEKLDLDDSKIASLPATLNDLEQLNTLSIQGTLINKWPEKEWGKNLSVFNTKGSKLESKGWVDYCSLWKQLDFYKSKYGGIKISTQIRNTRFVNQEFRNGTIDKNTALAWHNLIIENRKRIKASLDNRKLLTALNSDNNILKEAAIKQVDYCYAKAKKQPIDQNSVYYLLGNFEGAEQLLLDLEDKNLSTTSQFSSASHIIIGNKIDEKSIDLISKELDEKQQLLISQNIINKYIGRLSENQVETLNPTAILDLLHSTDSQNIDLALVVLHKNGINSILETELYLLFLETKAIELKEKIKAVLVKYGSKKLLEFLKQPAYNFNKLLSFKPCNTINRNLKKIQKAGINAIRVAQYYAAKNINTHSYIFEQGSKADIDEAIAMFLQDEQTLVIDIPLNKFPKEFYQLKGLTSIRINNLECKELPIGIENLQQLSSLAINEGKLEALPQGLDLLPHLKQLSITGTNIRDIFVHNKELEQLKSLEKLLFVRTKFQKLPLYFHKLKALKSLTFDETAIVSFEEQLGGMPSLEYLKLRRNHKLIDLSPTLYNSAKLKEINLERNKRLKALPEGIDNLKKLEKLVIIESSFKQFPSRLGMLKKLRHLTLIDNEKNPDYPKDFSSLQNLKHLNLSAQPSRQLPDSIGSLTQLKKLEIKNISTTKSLPSSLWNLLSLEELSLSNYAAKKGLPKQICQLAQLKTLRLSGLKEAESLPEGIEKLQQLACLDLSKIRKTSLNLDKSLLQLKQLKEIILTQTDDASFSKESYQVLSKLEQAGVVLVTEVV